MRTRFFTRALTENEVRYSYFVSFLRKLSYFFNDWADKIVDEAFDPLCRGYSDFGYVDGN